MMMRARNRLQLAVTLSELWLNQMRVNKGALYLRTKLRSLLMTCLRGLELLLRPQVRCLAVVWRRSHLPREVCSANRQLTTVVVSLAQVSSVVVLPQIQLPREICSARRRLPRQVVVFSEEECSVVGVKTQPPQEACLASQRQLQQVVFSEQVRVALHTWYFSTLTYFLYSPFRQPILFCYYCNFCKPDDTGSASCIQHCERQRQTTAPS